jgi:mitochondrial enoyl-[acyl-carrier protein] reductase / trans-2-enoyl-CoA reductase
MKLSHGSICCSDINTVQGVYPLGPKYLGIGGHEGVGTVVKTGAGVLALKEGDHVVPLVSGLGTWRTAGVFEASDWHAVDCALPVRDAATLAINPGTALLMLERFCDLVPGDVIVQNGANSTVGQYVIQIARSRGLKTINIVRDRDDWVGTAAGLIGLGADLVSKPEEVRTDARDSGLPSPKLALNCVGGDIATTMAKMLAPGGTLVTYGGMSRKPVTVPTPVLIFRDVRVRGFWISGLSEESADTSKKRELLDRLSHLVLDGAIKLPAAVELPFTRWQEAFKPDAKGKFLLIMQDEK